LWLLLFDEFVVGLNYIEKIELFVLLRRIGDFGIVVVFIEYDMGLVM